MQSLQALLNSGGSVLQIRWLERLPLGTSYVGVVSHVARLLSRVGPHAQLVIDFTGVGRPVFDLFASGGISPTGILITAGTQETREGKILHVPKLSLISRLQALLHTHRLRLHRDIPDAKVLVQELQDYRVEYSPTGNLTFNARSGRHDDVLLATACAAWVAMGGSRFPYQGLYELYREQSNALTGTVTPDVEVVGVDLGQSRDPTAICVARRVNVPAGVLPPLIEEPEPMPAEPAQTKIYAQGSQENPWTGEELAAGRASKPG